MIYFCYNVLLYPQSYFVEWMINRFVWSAELLDGKCFAIDDFNRGE